MPTRDTTGPDDRTATKGPVAALLGRMLRTRRREKERPADSPNGSYGWRARNTPAELARSLTALHDGYVAHEWLRSGRAPGDGAARDDGIGNRLDEFAALQGNGQGGRSATRAGAGGRTYGEDETAELAQSTIERVAARTEASSGWLPWPWRENILPAARVLRVQLQRNDGSGSRYHAIGERDGNGGWQTGGRVWSGPPGPGTTGGQVLVGYAIAELAPALDWLMNCIEERGESTRRQEPGNGQRT